ncbi:MAG: transposase, partial [Patescibacteria group bacterium]
MNIFLDEEDYLFFLRRMKEALYPLETKTMMPIAGQKQWASLLPRRRQLPPDTFSLLLYALMPSHFHLGIMQNTELPLSAFMSKICTSYSKYFNKKYGRVGSVFQDQFKAVIVTSNEQLLWLVAYIHNNPIKAGLVKDLNKYPYSSHLDYIGARKGMLCKRGLILGQYKSVENYVKDIMGFEENLLLDDLKIDSDDTDGHHLNETDDAHLHGKV